MITLRQQVPSEPAGRVELPLELSEQEGAEPPFALL